jgi:arylsulfatase A-like enzyme
MRCLRVIPLLCAALLGCEAGPRPNLIMVVVDTLRADHLGCYGYERGTSPHIDAFAAESQVFDNAVAQSSWTSPSVASLFTSAYPSVHGVTGFGSRLPPTMETLAEVLQGHGFRTAAFSANFAQITQRNGFAQGFDTFQVIKKKWRDEDKQEGDVGKWRAAGAIAVTKKALAWLREESAAPFFLYLHYMDPHSDYNPPTPLRKRFENPYDGAINGSTKQILQVERGELSLDEADRSHLIDLYDAEVATADAGFGRVLEYLEEEDLLGGSVVVILSDHGEEFLDHGRLFHGFTLYAEMIRVPLIVRAPGLEAGRRISQLVELIDVGPTVLDLLQIPDERSSQGRSLTGLLDGESPGQPDARAYSELSDDAPLIGEVRGRTHSRAVWSESWSYLQRMDGTVELYEHSGDPGQTANRIGAEGETARAFEAELQSLVAVLESAAKPAPAAGAPVGEEEREQLRTLGYLE